MLTFNKTYKGVGRVPIDLVISSIFFGGLVYAK